MAPNGITYVRSTMDGDYNFAPDIDNLLKCYAYKKAGHISWKDFYQQITAYMAIYIRLKHGYAFDPCSKHIELLSILHEDNEELSIKLMKDYPRAWKHVDEPWALWTKLIS